MDQAFQIPTWPTKTLLPQLFQTSSAYHVCCATISEQEVQLISITPNKPLQISYAGLESIVYCCCYHSSTKLDLGSTLKGRRRYMTMTMRLLSSHRRRSLDLIVRGVEAIFVRSAGISSKVVALLSALSLRVRSPYNARRVSVDIGLENPANSSEKGGEKGSGWDVCAPPLHISRQFLRVSLDEDSGGVKCDGHITLLIRENRLAQLCDWYWSGGGKETRSRRRPAGA